MQLKFGDQSIIQTVRFPPPERLTAADLQPVLDSVKARSEAVSKLREIYRSTSVTLHIYGDQLGHNAYEGLLDLASSENDFVRCAPPQVEVLASAMANLGAKNTVTLDLTALGTLRLLGITRQVLTSGAFHFAISPATFTELQLLRVQSRFSAAHGTLSYQKGQHYFTQTTDTQSGKQSCLRRVDAAR
jgi:hypothetical protein